MLSRCRVGAACFACEDSARCSRTRSLVCHSRACVSRGVSAIEAALAFELGPARPSSLAARPENEIRDAFDPFLLPYNSVNEHPYPLRFRPIVTGSSPGVYSMGCRPPRPEILRFTTQLSLWRIARVFAVVACWALSGFALTPGFPPQVFPGHDAVRPCL